MLNNHKKIKILVAISFIILVLLALGIQILKVKEYYLINDWIYLILNAY